jgi:hypothetical protein
MNKEQLKRIFEFLEEKENKTPKDKGNLRWKLTFNEPLTEKDLDIEGDLDLTYSNIESLPEGLEVSGDLILSYCENISSLPEGLIVRGNLILQDCSQLYSLPKGLKVGGTLYIDMSPLSNYSNGELRNMVGDDGYLKRVHYF